jgi:multidrug resistance efflux pump
MRLDLTELKRQRGEMEIRAPVNCVITRLALKVGDMVAPGKIGMTIAPQGKLEFDAVVDNADVARLQPGLSVRIKLDAYDFQTYGVATGRIRFVAPDAQAKQGPSGRISMVYFVKIDLDREQVGQRGQRGPLKLGMTGRAEIVTARESILTIMLRRLRQKVSLS